MTMQHHDFNRAIVFLEIDTILFLIMPDCSIRHRLNKHRDKVLQSVSEPFGN